MFENKRTQFYDRGKISAAYPHRILTQSSTLYYHNTFADMFTSLLITMKSSILSMKSTSSSSTLLNVVILAQLTAL